MDVDSLNTPAGKLVGVFLAGCYSLTKPPYVFGEGSDARQMRDAVIAAPGRSGLIVRRRLIEQLPYFLRADVDWTRENLINPLLAEDAQSLALWRAIARRTLFTDVLRVIGEAMAEKAVDRRPSRETRRSLVFSLVVESMHAFLEGREPAVANPRITQTLRSLDDEVRAWAAEAVQKFVRDLSTKIEGDSKSAADLFRSAAAPFLSQVWPQERSLTTPGISHALADLPATSDDAFAEVVETIERFLVPFDCWSLSEYGLRGQADGKEKLAKIDDETKAKALLKLLDLTIGSHQGSVVPYDLTDALDAITTVAPRISTKPAFRRLSTIARR